MVKILFVIACIGYAQASVVSTLPAAPLASSLEYSPLTGIASPVSRILNHKATELIDLPLGHETYGVPLKSTTIFRPALIDDVNAKLISDVHSLKYPLTDYYSVYPHTSPHYHEYHQPIFSTYPYPPKQSDIVLPHTPTAEIISKGVEIVPEAIEVKKLSHGKKNYHSSYALDNGTKVVEEGRLLSTSDGWEDVVEKRGSYEYISPEGTPIKVQWIADDKGFRVL